MNRDEYRGLPQFVLEARDERNGPEEQVAREIDRALGALGTVLSPEVPSPAARSRLLAAVTTGPVRYAPFFDRLEQLFDLGRDPIVRIFERIDLVSSWNPGPHPSVRVMHFPGGPAVANADTGLVRMPSDFVWPRHRHHGVERALILEGEYTDSDDRVYRAGDIHEMGAGSEHSFTVPRGAPLLLAVTLFGGIEIL
jgi:hypothetical protein